MERLKERIMTEIITELGKDHKDVLVLDALNRLLATVLDDMRMRGE